MARRTPGYGFEQRLGRAAAEQGLFVPGVGPVVVGVSGGGDSVALLAGLCAVAARAAAAPEIVAAHLNHRLRGAASDRDALFVAVLARGLGVRCFVGDVGSDVAPAHNVEANARAARGGFFGRIASALGASSVCLAHTRDDQAETVLMRLARGGGIAAVAAMEARRADGVARPLLATPRGACRSYVAARGMPTIEDLSNRDERYLRNRVRHRALPALDAVFRLDVGARLARLAVELRVESVLAQQRLDALLEASDAEGGLGVSTVIALGPAAGRLLHAWLGRAGYRPSERQIGALVALARGGAVSGSIRLGSDLVVRREYARLRVCTRSATDALGSAPVRPTELHIPGETQLARWVVAARAPAPAAALAGLAEAAPGVSRFRAPLDLLCLPLRARPWVAGDRIRLGGGTRKLSDVFGAARVPRHARTELLVVVDADDSVLWVPGVATAALGQGDCASEILVLEAWRCGLPL